MHLLVGFPTGAQAARDWADPTDVSGAPCGRSGWVPPSPVAKGSESLYVLHKLLEECDSKFAGKVARLPADKRPGSAMLHGLRHAGEQHVLWHRHLDPIAAPIAERANWAAIGEVAAAGGWGPFGGRRGGRRRCRIAGCKAPNERIVHTTACCAAYFGFKLVGCAKAFATRGALQFRLRERRLLSIRDERWIANGVETDVGRSLATANSMQRAGRGTQSSPYDPGISGARVHDECRLGIRR